MSIYEHLIDIKRHNTLPTMDVYRVRGLTSICGEKKQEHITLSELRKNGYPLMKYVHSIRVIKKAHVFGYYTILLTLRQDVNYTYRIVMDNFPNSLQVILGLLGSFINLMVEHKRLVAVLATIKKINDPLRFIYLSNFIEHYNLLKRFATNRGHVTGISRKNLDMLCATLETIGLTKKHEVHNGFIYKRTSKKEDFESIADEYVGII